MARVAELDIDTQLGFAVSRSVGDFELLPRHGYPFSWDDA